MTVSPMSGVVNHSVAYRYASPSNSHGFRASIDRQEGVVDGERPEPQADDTDGRRPTPD